MFQTKFPNSVIKSCYIKAFDETLELKERKSKARGVVDTIVNGVFFENISIFELFIVTNEMLSDKGAKVYFTSFSGKLRFLVDQKLISETLSLQYQFVYSEGGKFSNAHPRFKNGESKIMIIIQIYLNNILIDLLDRFEESKEYLISFKVLEEKDSKFYYRVTNQIDTFWNIKKSSTSIFKYSSIFRFVALIFLIPLFWPLALIICLLEIYNTKTLVFDGSLKKKRRLVFNSLLSLILFVSIFNLYFLLKKNDEAGTFNPNSAYQLKSSLSLVYKNDSVLLKSLDFNEINEKENIEVKIYQDYHNIGIKNILRPKAKLDFIFEKNQLLIVGTLSSLTSIQIDTVKLINFKSNYSIRYLDGFIYSPFNSEFKDVGYYKILDEKDYLNFYNNDKNIEIDNNLLITNVIDNSNFGELSRGFIASKFLINEKENE